MGRYSLRRIGGVVLAAAAVGLGVGVWQGGVVTGGGGTPGAFYIATTGSDVNSGTSASPFLTMNKCYQASSKGGICYLKTGAYGDQDILNANAKSSAGGHCWWGGPFLLGNVSAGSTNETQDLTGCIQFTPAPAATVTINDMIIDAPYVYLNGLTIGTGLHNATNGDLSMQNLNCTAVNNYTDTIVRNTTGEQFNLKGVQHFYMIGDTWNMQYTGANASKNQITDCNSGQTDNVNDHVMIDGNLIENVYWTQAGQHLEAIQFEEGDHVTIQNSRFLNDAQDDWTNPWGTSNQGHGGSYWLIQNNVLDSTCSHQQFNAGGGCNSDGNGTATNGNHIFNHGVNGAGQVEQHWLIRFNSMPESTAAVADYPQAIDSAGTMSDVYLIGNIMAGLNNCSPQTTDIGVVWDHNVEQSAAGGACGTNTALTAADQYTNFHTYTYTLTSCSVSAANEVPSSVVGGFPATDINGITRPQGTNADAGAYEACS